jgi:hypothetical protein
MIHGRPRYVPHPNRPHRYEDAWVPSELGLPPLRIARCACGAVRDDAAVKRGRNNRARGNRGELTAARKYGGEKVGPLGLPEDIRGKEWRTSVKTIAGPPPATWSVTAEWREWWAALGVDYDGHRWPRLLLVYRPSGRNRDFFVVPRRVADLNWGGLWQIRHGWLVDDYFVVRGEDWLAWFGKDE